MMIWSHIHTGEKSKTYCPTLKHTHTRTHSHTQAHTHTHTHTHTRTHARTHARTRTRTHTHRQKQKNAGVTLNSVRSHSGAFQTSEYHHARTNSTCMLLRVLACFHVRVFPSLPFVCWLRVFERALRGTCEGSIMRWKGEAGPLSIYLLSWCFEPSQPQRISSGLNTNFNLQVIYFTSVLLLLLFLAYSYSAGTQHGNLHPAGRPI